MPEIDSKLNDLAQLVAQALKEQTAPCSGAGNTPLVRESETSPVLARTGSGPRESGSLYGKWLEKLASRKLWTVSLTIAALLASNQLNLGLSAETQAIVAALATAYIAIQAQLDKASGQAAQSSETLAKKEE